MKALLSVSDKTGLVELAQRLHDKKVELIATGGTARALKNAGLPVTLVEELTGSPEILEGRVKTLHPRVHAGVLARDTDPDRADLARIGAEMIDLVIANLYPFQNIVAQKFVTLRDAIENIDIGGVALLRAAAKNFARVAVVCDPDDYGIVAHDIEKKGVVSLETREVLALKVFAHTAAYDTAIRDYLMGVNDEASAALSLSLHKVQELRYGENPHQEAALYSFDAKARGPLNGRALHGKELSYNNLLDLDAAWRAALQFNQPAIVIVKHLSPCGIACADTLPRAFNAAYACDPTSAFGGVIASNWEIDVDTVKAMGDLFVECLIAPGFQDEAVELLRKRKNVRLVEADPQLGEHFEYRSIVGGLLRQSIDKGDPPEAHWKCVTKAQPTDEQTRALAFAWAACQHVKSNAIVFAKEHNGVMATVGIGGGQPNRVDSVRIAAARAGKQAKGAALASDAFFPFPDGVKEAIKAGITAIVQPGGSQRDAEAIAAANEAGIVMLFTGVRHFRH